MSSVATMPQQGNEVFDRILDDAEIPANWRKHCTRQEIEAMILLRNSLGDDAQLVWNEREYVGTGVQTQTYVAYWFSSKWGHQFCGAICPTAIEAVRDILTQINAFRIALSPAAMCIPARQVGQHVATCEMKDGEYLSVIIHPDGHRETTFSPTHENPVDAMDAAAREIQRMLGAASAPRTPLAEYCANAARSNDDGDLAC